MRTTVRMKRFSIALTVLILLSLLGCQEAAPTVSTTAPSMQSTPPATTVPVQPSTPPATTAPTEPALTTPTEPAWPDAMPANTQLFQLFQYNGSLKVNWQTVGQNQSIWVSDPENKKFFVKELDYDRFYDATFWIRLELTSAGQHYCDESWNIALNARVLPENGKNQQDALQNVTITPYYKGQMLAGWLIFGSIKSSVPAQLELAGEAGGQRQNIWLTPSVANTYISQELFSVTKIDDALQITQGSNGVCSLQWQGNTYYLKAEEQGLPETAVIWFMVKPQQEFLQSKNVQNVCVQEYLPVCGLGNPYSFHFTGSIRLYADSECTELALIYVYVGEEYMDHVYLSLRWTDNQGANQCTKVVTYTPGIGK